VAKYDDALAVPIQAVVRRGPSPTVYVQTRTGFEPRPVQIGLDNARLVHITDGLQPGDVVSLAPPLADAASEPIQGPDPDAVGDIPAPAEKPSSRSNAQPGTDAQAKPQAESEAAAPNRQNSKRPSAESPDTERAGDERQNPAERGGRRDWSNMSEEQKEKARERFRNMSPEQRRKLREQGQERRQQGDS